MEIIKLFFCLLLLIASPVDAQMDLVFSEINSNDGLSENNIRSIAQLPDGRMVFKTQGLTNIYNGSSFHYIHVDDQKTYSLENYTGFHHTYIDASGNVWIKNRHELVLLDMQSETYVNNLDSVFKVLNITEQVTDFFIDSEKNIWCSSDRNKLLLIEKETQKPSIFLSKIPFHDKGTDILYDIATVDQYVYLFFRSGLIICYNKATKKELFRDNSIAQEYSDTYFHSLLVVKHKKYLYQIRNGNNKGIIHRYNVETNNWEVVLKKEYYLNTLTVNRNNDIIVSCKEGLWYISEDLKTKNNISTLQLVDGKEIHNEISVIYTDNQDGLWVGSFNRGLLYYHPARFKFRNIGSTLFNVNNGNELKVNSFTQLDSDILISTDLGLYIYSSKTSILKPFKKLPEDNHYTCLYNDSKNRIWLGTTNNTLFCLEGNKIKKHKLPHAIVNDLYEYKPDLFILSTSEGLLYFNSISGKSTSIICNYAQFSSVNHLVQLEENSFLGISNAGLFVYNATNNQFTFANSNNTKDIYPIFKQKNKHINCLYADSRGMIWCATRDGLSFWNTNNNNIQYFYTSDGLVNNNIQSIVEDKKGEIWLSTSNGITSVTVRRQEEDYNFSFTNYNRFDGVVDYEFIERSVFRSQDGKIYWGGLDGFNWIDINTFKENDRLLAKPVFVAISLFGKEISLGTEYNGNVILHQTLAKTEEVHLKHNQNFISLDFSALNYINPSQTYYKYRLEGVDEKWNFKHANNGLGHVNYTNLSPGTYLFKVYAANSSKKWGEFAQIKIIITPPFWTTPLAYILYILLLILVVYLLISNYIKKSRLKLEQTQEKKLNALKMRFFTNVSHELRTPLSLIITPLETLLKQVEDKKLNSALEGIHKNARSLLNLVNQLLDFRRLEISGESLNLRNVNVGVLVEDLCIPFNELAHSKEITLSYECKQTDFFASVDEDKFWKIVNNLLSNAVKFTPPKGQISVTLNKRFSESQQKHFLVLEVCNTGVIIPEEEMPLVFNRFYQTNKKAVEHNGSGIGLHLTKEYVELHNGSIEVKSSEKEGVLFLVNIPLDVTDEHDSQSLTIKNSGDFKLAVIEDNSEFRKYLCSQLREIYEVISATNGKEGIALIREHMPDLVISDIMMPEMSGIELCKRLKNDLHISHIPVILLTARFSEDAQLEGFEAKADAYITKPFNINILLQRIQNLLELQKKRHEIYKKAVVIHPKSITSTSVDEELIRKAIASIEKNIDNTDYSVELLGKEMAMDRTGLYRKLQILVGQTPSAFIRSFRLKHAAQLLEQGRSVSEVSTMVGFGTISYFSKCFQEEFGVKPSEFRKSAQ